MNNLLILKLQKKFNNFFNYLSNIEDLIIGNSEKKKLVYNKHIFLTGMPRSGTTILTHILSNFDDVGTYNYSDLPFFKLPYFWSKFNKFYYSKNKSFSRPHGDGLKIDISSPDAFEELIWSENLENYSTDGFFKYLDNNYENKILEDELTRNINKILIIRKKKIYLSKGNYNIFRIKYIQKVFKSSFVILCIRNPFDVIKSSIQTHKNFIEESKKNKNFDNEMKELCHFEFGNSRININSNQNNKDDFDYYLNQWKSIHNLIYSNYLNRKNIYLFNFDQFLSDPYDSILKLSKKINLNYTNKVNDYIKFNVKKKLTNSNKIENSDVNSLYLKLIEKCIN